MDSKKQFGRVMVLLLFLCLMPAFAWTMGQAATAESKATLALWDSTHIPPDEQKKAQEDWYITKALRRFEAANPGVSVELTVIPDEAKVHQTFKAAAVAGNAPDVCQLWPGSPIFPLRDVVLDLEGKVSADDLKNLSGWDELRDNFDPKGKLLGFPTGLIDITFFLYNRNLVASAGLDFEANPPLTVAQFDAACEKLKQKGILPIVSDEGTFPRMVYFITDYWWGQLVGGSPGILKYNTGEKKFTNDKDLGTVLAYYQKLYANGYINHDAASSSDALQRFFQGEAAMLPAVNGMLARVSSAMGGYDNLGIVFAPDISASAPIKHSTMAGPGKCFVIAKSSKHPEMALKLASFLSSKSEVIRFAAEVGPLFSIRKDMTSAEMGLPDNLIYKKQIDIMSDPNVKIVYWVDQVLAEPAITTLVKLAPLVLTAKMTPNEVAVEMDKAMSGQ
jgi:raffinose/stachyose/melibiose transport system substrate-binding protein